MSAGRRGVPRLLQAAAVTVVVAAAVRVFYGPGLVGYDGTWALIWGRAAARGDLPLAAPPGSPTPHPLTNLVGALLAPLGPQARPVYLAIAVLAAAAAGLALVALGRELGSPLAGWLALGLALTRAELVADTLAATVDPLYVALVLWALAIAVHRRHEPAVTPVLVLLALAGLLRPEAWLLAAAYGLAVWSGPLAPVVRMRGAGPVALPVLVLAAPVIWIMADVVLFGDPLHSLAHTQAGAEALGRPRGFGTALRRVVPMLTAMAGPVVLGAGLAGAGLAWKVIPERAGLPLATLSLSVVAYLLLGLAEVSLLPRDLLLATLLLCLCCGWLIAGLLEGRWIPDHPDRTPAPARAARLAGPLLLVALVVTVAAADVPRMHRFQAAIAGQRAADQDLAAVLSPPVAGGCSGLLRVPDPATVPLAAWHTGRPLDQIAHPGQPGRASCTLEPTEEGPSVLARLGFGPPLGGDAPSPPPGRQLLAAGDTWRLLAPPPAPG